MNPPSSFFHTNVSSLSVQLFQLQLVRDSLRFVRASPLAIASMHARATVSLELGRESAAAAGGSLNRVCRSLYPCTCYDEGEARLSCILACSQQPIKESAGADRAGSTETKNREKERVAEARADRPR